MSDVTIIGFDASNFVRTARLACEEKGISHTLDAAELTGPGDLRKPAHLVRHPFGRMPVLQHAGRNIFETTAICRYIDGTFDGPPLLPRDPDAAIEIEQWTSAMTYYLDRHVIREVVLQYIFPKGPDGQPDRARIDAAIPEIELDLSALERGLERGPFFGGDRPTLPDLLLLPIVDYLETVPEGPGLLANAPRVRQFHAAFKARPSHGATLPERMKKSA